MDKELKGHFFKNQKSEWGKCQFPSDSRCTSTPIRAHSIQNRGTLGALSEAGHVVMIDVQVDRSLAVVPVFKRIGRNKATTFAGLCAKHDQELFHPIDTSAIYTTNPEHTFLVSYRSILREFVAMANRTIKLQAGYRELVRRGLVSADRESEPGTEAVGAMIESWAFFRHMCLYHDVYLAGRWNDIHHVVVNLAGPSPGFACSGVYAIRNNMLRTDHVLDYQCAALNLFPTALGATLMISFPEAHRASWASHAAMLAEPDGAYQKYLVSKLVLRHCENFVIKPSTFDSWSIQKKEGIMRYFVANLFMSKHDYEDEHLYLF